MTHILDGATVGFGAWCIASALLTASFMLVRARDNAAKRKARRAMSDEALELALMRREFDRIVAASYARKDHA